MTISTGIRLVIIFPTLFFLIGCLYRSITERTDFKEVLKINKTVARKLGFSFYFLLSIDSLFLFLANGLIIIFELGFPELGIITMILGAILSVSLIVAIHSEHSFLSEIGIYGIFGGLGGISIFFAIIDTNIITLYNLLEPIAIVLGIILGFIVGHSVGLLVDPTKD